MIDLALIGFMLAVLAATLEASSKDSLLIGRKGIIPYFLSLNRHICIYGPTRSGKTAFIRYLVSKLSRRYIVTVLDWHGEYSDLEILTIGYDMVQVDVSKIPLKLLTEILGHGLGLNEPSMYMLYRILKNSKLESIRDILSSVEEYFATTRTEAEMKAAILRRLEYVLANMSRGILDPEILTKESCCIDLSGLTVIEEKRLAASLILTMIYVYYMRNGIIRKDPTHFIIIEEAQNLMKDKDYNSILHHIVLELAKYGVRVILVTNTLPDSTILTHCNLLIFKIRPEYMQNLVVSEDLHKTILSMRDHEVLVLTPNEINKIVVFKKKPQKYRIRRIAETCETYENVLPNKKSTRDIMTTQNSKKEKSSTDENRRSKDKIESRKKIVEEHSDVKLQISNYLRKIDEIEKRLALIRERLDEIERTLAYEDEVLKKIMEKLMQ